MSNSFRLLTDQKSFTELLDVIGETLNLPTSFRPDIPPFWSFQAGSSLFDFADLLESAKRQASRFERTIRKDDSARRFLCSVKAAWLAADSAGSGLVRASHDLESWVKAAFGTVLSARDIQREVIVPRIQEIERTTKQDFRLQDFQEKRALYRNERSCSLRVVAEKRWPPGTGSRHAWRKDRRPGCSFSTPLAPRQQKGSRLCAWAPQEDAALAHGTAAYDLEEMFSNPADTRRDKDFTTEQRLYALGLAKAPFQCNCGPVPSLYAEPVRPLCLLPLLVDSVIVVDEIHSFDKSMFSALTKFLKQFDVPSCA